MSNILETPADLILEQIVIHDCLFINNVQYLTLLASGILYVVLLLDFDWMTVKTINSKI